VIMPRSRKALGIVLAKKNWREDDRLFSIFTNEFGKIEAVAVGAKKIKSKLAGHLASCGIVELEFVRGKSINKITHAYLIKNYALKSGADFLGVSCLLETMDKALPLGEINIEIWNLLRSAIERVLHYRKVEEKKLVVSLFVIKILPILGYRISFEQKWLYAHRFSVSDELKGLVERLQSKSFVAQIKLSRDDNKKLFSFLAKYLNYYFEKQFFCYDLLINY